MQLYTADGIRVDVPMAHMKQHSDVLTHLDAAVRTIRVGQNNFIKTEIDFGIIIGTTDCVETSQYDDIVYATREGRPWQSRFAMNRKPQPCSHVTVVLKKVGESYRLLTAYIGRLAEREPDDISIRDDSEYMRAKHFWSNHALVWGRQEVVS